MSFGFFLASVGLPLGVNAGVYRYSHSTKTVIPVVVPGVTPAPGGGTFAGTSYGFGLTNLNNRGDLVFPGIVPGADIAGPAGRGWPGAGGRPVPRRPAGQHRQRREPGRSSPEGAPSTSPPMPGSTIEATSPSPLTRPARSASTAGSRKTSSSAVFQQAFI